MYWRTPDRQRGLMKKMKATNWYVITGAPCSGKTTVILELEKQKHRVVHEVARWYIDMQLKKGKRLEAIKSDPLTFERAILYEKVAIEQRLPTQDVVFFDRAVPDSIAYFKVEGLDPAEPLKHCREHRYRRVFLFDRLGFEKDSVRAENSHISARLDSLIEDSYRHLGYDPVRVPVMSVVKRMQFVLQDLTSLT